MEINELAQKLTDARAYKTIADSPLLAYMDKRIHDYELELYSGADNVLELVARIRELKELRLRITRQANKVAELEMKLREAGVSL